MSESRIWKRIKEAIDWGRRLHWIWMVFPAGWKALIVAAILGAIPFALALARQINLGKAWLYCVAAICMYGVSWIVIQKLSAPSARSGVLEVKMRELYRRPNDNYNKSPFDLFLKVWLNIKSPRKAQIIGSRFELSFHGAVEVLIPLNDLEQWEINIWDSKPLGPGIMSLPLTPLPSTICQDEPIEGWLHFATKETTGNVLEKCAIRLVIQTNVASGYREHEADPDIWNPLKISISRRIDGKLWNP